MTWQCRVLHKKVHSSKMPANFCDGKVHENFGEKVDDYDHIQGLILTWSACHTVFQKYVKNQNNPVWGNFCHHFRPHPFKKKLSYWLKIYKGELIGLFCTSVVQKLGAHFVYIAALIITLYSYTSLTAIFHIVSEVTPCHAVFCQVQPDKMADGVCLL